MRSLKRNSFSFTSLESINEAKPKEDNTKIFFDCDDILNLKMSLDKSILHHKTKIITKFLDAKIKYEEGTFIKLSSLSSGLKKWANEKDPTNVNTIVYSISKLEMDKYIQLRNLDRVLVKHLSFCKSCDNRYFNGCCTNSSRMIKLCVINIRL
jgi:hypothetical protein